MQGRTKEEIKSQDGVTLAGFSSLVNFCQKDAACRLKSGVNPLSRHLCRRPGSGYFEYNLVTSFKVDARLRFYVQKKLCADVEPWERSTILDRW